MFLRFYKMKTNQIQGLNQQNIRRFRIVIEKVYEGHHKKKRKATGSGWRLPEERKGMILADTADTAWTKVKDRERDRGLEVFCMTL